MSDIVDELQDLHKQATTERSHNYTARVIERAIAEVTRLRALVAFADSIRVAQRAYMADRGNEQKGKAVAAAVALYDVARIIE